MPVSPHLMGEENNVEELRLLVLFDDANNGGEPTVGLLRSIQPITVKRGHGHKNPPDTLLKVVRGVDLQEEHLVTLRIPEEAVIRLLEQARVSLDLTDEAAQEIHEQHALSTGPFADLAND